MRVFKLIFKNALRHKLRTLLTILGISIAVIAFGILRTVVTAWSAGVEGSAANRLITRHAVSFIFPLPYTYRDKISQIPGVGTSYLCVLGFRAFILIKINFLLDWQSMRKLFLMFIQNF